MMRENVVGAYQELDTKSYEHSHNLCDVGTITVPCYRWESWGPGKVNILLKDIVLASEEPGLEPRPFCSESGLLPALPLAS